jgi:hypothetical protein
VTTFPAAPLGATTELDLGGTWTDITSYTDYTRQAIQLVRGHPDESIAATPSSMTLALDNTTATFSPANPTGPYYGNLGRNTPVRLSIPAQTSYLRLEADQSSAAACPDAAGLHITGDIDIRIDVQITGYSADVLCSKWNTSATNGFGWLVNLDDAGQLEFFWSDNGTDFHAAASTAPVPPGRQCLRVTMAVSTGTVTFYTGPAGGADGSTWTQLGSQAVFGATSIFATTAQLAVGGYDPAVATTAGTNGSYYEFELRSGIAGTVKAHPVFSAQTAGATSFADAQGNTWTLHGTAELSGRDYRAHLEAASWTPSSDETGISAWTNLAASGILRRIQQGTKPLQSTFRYALPSAAGLIGYWPCEDGNSTTGGGTPAAPTQFASALTGVAAGVFAGTPTFASDSGFLCSYPIPVLNGSQWRFLLPARSSTDTANVMRFLMHVPAGGDTDGQVVGRLNTNGTLARVDLLYYTGGALGLTAYNSSGTQLFSTGAVSYNVNGELAWVSVELQTSGSAVQYSVVTLAPGAGGAVGGTLGTQASASIGNTTSLAFNPATGLSGTAIGQITYQSVWTSLYTFINQLNAYQGEAAGDRFSRLCAEQGIPFRAIGGLSDTTAMGPQTPLALMTLLQECADADRGQIFEPRQALALGYRTRASMQNQAARLALDYSTDDLASFVQSTEDDQYTVNDVTVTRAYTATGGTGSSSEVAVTSGPLSTQDPPNGVGEYITSLTANVNLDSQCQDLAGWIASIGTVDQPRIPAIVYDLGRGDIGTARWTVPALDLGDRLTVASLPAWLPPDGITQLVAQSTEDIAEKSYKITWCCVPETPYETALLDDPVYAAAGTDGSTLHANITSAATSMQVDTTNASSPLWTTAAGDFPFDIEMGGERITVTNITGTSSPQTFTITRSVNGVVKAHTAGEAVTLFFPAIMSL